MVLKEEEERTGNIPVVTDSFITRISVMSVDLMKGAVDAVDRDALDSETFSEDWFRRPFAVAEKLADRLSLSEQCIKQRVSWAGYKELTGTLDMEF